ncbi:MAG: response regulator [Calditrichaceae bacterium]
MKKTVEKHTRILLVDDDPNVQRMVGLFLNREKMDVECVGNGRIALHKLTTESFDIILSDIQMPQMDGITLMKEIKTRKFNIPVVVLSGFGLENMAMEAMELGAYEVLQKPFDSSCLIDAIRRTLKEHLERTRELVLKSHSRKTKTKRK